MTPDADPLSPTGFEAPDFEANAARALFDGEAYAEMRAMLARAQASIRMEFFLFGGRQADAMIDLLAHKRAAGVRVQVTLDSSRDLFPQHRRERDAAYARLRVLGLDVVLSDPARSRTRPVGGPCPTTSSSSWTTARP